MQLTGLAKKTNKKVAELGINALKNLIINGDLMGEVKADQLPTRLFVFSKNPMVIEKRDKISDEELLKCYYDHCVREVFRELVLNVLEKEMAHSDLEHYRMFAIDTLQELMGMTDAVELTENALSIIVNKLGDNSKKVQCHAI